MSLKFNWVEWVWIKLYKVYGGWFGKTTKTAEKSNRTELENYNRCLSSNSFPQVN